MANSLTRTAALKIGPVVFGTLLKHYFDRVRNERATDDGPAITQLRQDELLYDEAFNIVKVCKYIYREPLPMLTSLRGSSRFQHSK
jgi:hypothetical protein